jgi:hypothetical protein
MKALELFFLTLTFFVLNIMSALCYQYCWNNLVAPSGIFPSLGFNFILGLVLIKIYAYSGKVDPEKSVFVLFGEKIAALVMFAGFTKLALLCNFAGL